MYLYILNATTILPSNQPFWVSLIITLGIICLGYVYSVYRSRFGNLINSISLIRTGAKFSKEDQTPTHRVSLLLSFNFIFISALFILQLVTSSASHFNLTSFSFLSFLVVVGSILLIYIFKLLFLFLFAFVIDQSRLATEYSFITVNTNHLLGIVLIPIVICIAYSPKPLLPICIIAGIILVSVAYILRIRKGILSAFHATGTNLFYIILYLCTFEILPILVSAIWFERLVK